MWAIVWTDAAVRDMYALDRPVARRVMTKLEAAAVDAPRSFERLAAREDYKLRVGDYRVLALLSFEESTVIVQRVEHRSRVYKEGSR